MSDTSKSKGKWREKREDPCEFSESRSKTRSSWNPFRKVLSLVSGNRHDSIESINSSDGERVTLRWTASCINTTCPIFAKNPQFNMIYCPATSILMYVVVTLASEHSMTMTLRRLFELTDSDIQEIREMSVKLTELRSPHQFYCFVRFLVDEEPTTTVSKELMIRSNEVANQQVFASIRPSRVTKYLNSLTFSPVSFNRPSLLSTNGYGSAGLNAKWHGKTKKAGMHRFAVTYHKKKYEVFFEIRTAYRTVQMENFEVFEVPFKFGSGSFGSLIFLRPHFIGHLPYVNRQLSAQSLSKMLDELFASQWIPQGKLLIPQFQVSGCHDLWKNLMRNGVQPDLGQSQKAPPMASLWHWTSLKVGSEGINGNTVIKKKFEKESESQKALKKTFHDRLNPEGLLQIHKPYAARIDSPFTYIVMVQGVPLFTGSFFGSPPPKSSDIFVNAPERIRQRHTAVIRKRKGKETRKQKLLRKLKKSEEREKEKDRKREKKHRNARRSASPPKPSGPSTSSSGSSTPTSEASSSKSSPSTKSSPISPKVSIIEKKEEEKKEEKSKSSAWRRFANRIFKRKH
ncbi:hypothetical protein CRE_29718 [Caenorhabditis remanei]|uniref:Serpin domain-containing protein n=1 Tax=Caenorhabditis remanei TaxID=31234 RepID=E3LVD2_CAERE|nr:hypothetical protein CRE_29718 [Caenorhabditis remanei]